MHLHELLERTSKSCCLFAGGTDAGVGAKNHQSRGVQNGWTYSTLQSSLSLDARFQIITVRWLNFQFRLYICYGKWHAPLIVLHVAAVPAAFVSSCNSFHMTSGFSLIFFIFNPRVGGLFVVPWTFRLHVIEINVPTGIWKILTEVLWLLKIYFPQSKCLIKLNFMKCFSPSPQWCLVKWNLPSRFESDIRYTLEVLSK